MRIVTLDEKRVAYDPATDVLFASLGDYDPSMLDEEISAGDGVYLQYSWPDHELAFIEVFGFSKRYGSLPVNIRLDTPEMMTIQLPRELVVA